MGPTDETIPVSSGFMSVETYINRIVLINESQGRIVIPAEAGIHGGKSWMPANGMQE